MGSHKQPDKNIWARAPPAITQPKPNNSLKFEPTDSWQYHLLTLVKVTPIRSWWIWKILAFLLPAGMGRPVYFGSTMLPKYRFVKWAASKLARCSSGPFLFFEIGHLIGRWRIVIRDQICWRNDVIHNGWRELRKSRDNSSVYRWLFHTLWPIILAMPYGHADLCQHCRRQWLVNWWHQAIIWPSVDLSAYYHSKAQWYSFKGNLTKDPSDIHHQIYLENDLNDLKLKSPRGQWV